MAAGFLAETVFAAWVLGLPAAGLVGFAEGVLALERLLVPDVALVLRAALPGLLAAVLVGLVDLVLPVFFAWVFLALMPAFMASPATSFKAAEAML